MSPRCSVLALLALLPLAFAACTGRSGAKSPTRQPPLVIVEPVQAHEVAVEVRAPIDLRPIAQVEVGSKTLGYLDLVLVDRGDVVKRHQLLALVRPSDLPQQLAEARGALAQAEASRLLARTNYDRAKQLTPDGVMSQQELQQSSAALATAEASEAAAKARSIALAVRLGETRIESPIDGVVAVRRLDPGALVGPGAGGTILTVVQMNVLRAFIPVNEQYAGRVRVGQEASFEFDALAGKHYTGKVVRLAPAFDPESRTLDAEVHLANASGELRPGMYGRGAIVLERHPHGLTVPIESVQTTRKNQYVFVVHGNVAQRRRIRSGVDGEEWLEVTEGLAEGESVVTMGAEALTNGAVVRVSREHDAFSGSQAVAGGGTAVGSGTAAESGTTRERGAAAGSGPAAGSGTRASQRQ